MSTKLADSECILVMLVITFQYHRPLKCWILEQLTVRAAFKQHIKLAGHLKQLTSKRRTTLDITQTQQNKKQR